MVLYCVQNCHIPPYETWRRHEVPIQAECGLDARSPHSPQLGLLPGLSQNCSVGKKEPRLTWHSLHLTLTHASSIFTGCNGDSRVSSWGGSVGARVL